MNTNDKQSFIMDFFDTWCKVIAYLLLVPLKVLEFAVRLTFGIPYSLFNTVFKLIPSKGISRFLLKGNSIVFLLPALCILWLLQELQEPLRTIAFKNWVTLP